MKALLEELKEIQKIKMEIMQREVELIDKLLATTGLSADEVPFACPDFFLDRPQCIGKMYADSQIELTE